MSLVVERFLICDGCFENFGVDTRHQLQTVSRLREESKLNGWKHKKGKDYCGVCLNGKSSNLK